MPDHFLTRRVVGRRHTDDDPEIVKRNLREMKERAKTRSAAGFTQHVNKRSDGTYYISDWYDADSTVASFENGREK